MHQAPMIAVITALALAGCSTAVPPPPQAKARISEELVPCEQMLSARLSLLDARILCGGGGGGGGGGSPPISDGSPLTPPDVSASYLDANARNYLEQAGVPNAGGVGATQWVQGCRVTAQQGAVTFNSGKTETCPWANTMPGWIILETDYEVLQNRNNRGSASVGAVNGPTTVTTTELGSKFKGAIEFAVKAGDIDAKTKLELEYQRMNQFQFKFDGQGNTLIGRVTANGGMFESSLIEIRAKAKLLRVY